VALKTKATLFLDKIRPLSGQLSGQIGQTFLIPSGNLSLEKERFFAGYISDLCSAKNFLILEIAE
jgi:hypothetical protein